MADWYIAINGEQQGPFSTENLQRRIAEGYVPRGTLVWREGMANWAPIEQVQNGTAPPVPRPVPQPQFSQPQNYNRQPGFDAPVGGVTVGGAAAGAVDGGWFSFRGRINRKRLWLQYILPIFLVNIVVSIVVSALAATQNQGAIIAGAVIAVIVSLILIVPGLAGGVKRCHDRDRSGWFLLVGIVPLLNIWVIVELYFLRGTPGPNRFGPDPLA